VEILKNKTILIISPQKWDFIHISKHYYAIELCKHNNTVYFLNPPSEPPGITIKKTGIHQNLYLIDYKLNCPIWLRFKLRILFDLFMSRIVSKILFSLPEKPDILWCFEPNLFSDLHIFNTNWTIYHPVDLVSYSYQIRPALKADVVFSVSKTILSKFQKLNKPTFFINHGLNDDFKELAEACLLSAVEANLSQKPKEAPDCIKAGYWGNLLIPSIDHALFIKIISENLEVEFNFWGPFEADNYFPEANIIQFIAFLKNSPNVKLHGPKHPKVIIKEIAQIEIFLIFYKYNESVYDCSNSHKLLEYLSTGKVIVSNYIDLYSSYEDLIYMPGITASSEIPFLFKKVLNNLKYYNSEFLQKQRIEIALENTYENQLKRIDKKLSELTYYAV
jgi:hypothetical protein